jgi:hypothetical protein
MSDLDFRFDFLSTREGCNKAIRHIEILHDVIKEFESLYNLADKLNDLLADRVITPDQILPILHSLLVDKYSYRYFSYNLEKNIDEFEKITSVIQRWDAFDMVLVYFHPELGALPINPKRKNHWEATHWLQKHELVTFFVGEFAETDAEEAKYTQCIAKLIELLSSDGKVDVPQTFKIGKFPYIEKSRPAPKSEEKPKKKKTAPAASSAAAKKTPKKRVSSQPSYQELDQAFNQVSQKSTVKTMSKMYGIAVTNELFHNGNVEAWKRIIRSYEYTYPNNQVVIYYDNEKINDINTLFVWGKVKRGRVILIAIVGNTSEIKDLAKLRRYLEEGASINFSRFLQGNPNMILRLF